MFDIIKGDCKDRGGKGTLLTTDYEIVIESHFFETEYHDKIKNWIRNEDFYKKVRCPIRTDGFLQVTDYAIINPRHITKIFTYIQCGQERVCINFRTDNECGKEVHINQTPNAFISLKNYIEGKYN